MRVTRQQLLLGVSVVALSWGLLGDQRANAVCAPDGTAAADAIACNGNDPNGVNGQDGADIITLAAGADVDLSVDGEDDGDTIQFAGSATIDGTAIGGGGDDLITISGLTSFVGGVTGGDGTDTINLNGGTIGANVAGQGGGDLINLNGSTVNTIFGDNGGTAGADTINLISGRVLSLVQGGDEIAPLGDSITMGAGVTVAQSIQGQGGNDTITLNGGSVGGNVQGNNDNDVINLNGGTIAVNVSGNDGNDTINLAGASVTGTIFGDAGADFIIATSGRANLVQGGTEGDFISIGGTATINTAVQGEAGTDFILLSGGQVGSLEGGADGDTIGVLGGFVVGDVVGGTGDDGIGMLDGTVGGDIEGEAGADDIEMAGGSVAGSIFGGDANDTIELTGGTIGTEVHGNGGADQILLEGGQIAGTVFGQSGADTILLGGATLSGSTIGGDIVSGIGADIITLTSGSVGGAVRGDADGDLITMDGASVGVNVEGEGGADTLVLNSGFVGENIYGDQGPGGDGADTIFVDNITLGAGPNTLLAGGGNDTVTLADGFGSQLSSLEDLAGDDGADLIRFDGLFGSLAGGFDGWEEMHVVNSAFLSIAPTVGTTRDLGVNVLWVDETSTIGGEGNSPLQTIVPGAFALQGAFIMADGDADDELIVEGAFTGGGTGLIFIDAALDATEAADTITLNGPTTDVSVPNAPPFPLVVAEGSTSLVVNDIGNGIGVLTGHDPGDGVRVIVTDDPANTEDDDFDLAGDPIQVGIFEYDLFRESDGFWYLQSDASEQAFADAAIPASMIAFGRDAMGTLYERVGDRRSAASNPGAAVWLRAFGSWSEHEGDLEVNGGSLDGVEVEQDSWGVQAGLDFEVMADAAGRLVAGAHAIYGQSDVTADNDLGDAASSIDWDVWGLGATATWYASYGLYADLVGQVLWYDGDLATESLGNIASPDGLGWGLSAEVGYAIPLGTNFEVVPQAQLAYQSVDFDDLDADGVDLSIEDGDSLEGRIGVTGEFGFGGGSKAYVEANIIHEFLGETEVTADGTTLAYDLGGTSAELGGGVTAQFGNISVYGEVNYRMPFDDGTTSLKATAGVRFDF